MVPTDFAMGEPGDMKRRTVSGAAVTAVSQLLNFALQMGSQIVMARLLDPAHFGLVAMVAPVLQLALSLADVGMSQAIVQRAELTHRQLTAMFWICVAFGTLLMLVMQAASPLVARLYGEPLTQWVTVVSAVLVLLSALVMVPKALMSRQMRFSTLSAIEVVSMAAGLGSGILAAWWGAGLWALVLMQGVNLAVGLVLGWSVCGWWPGRPRREPGMGALLRFGAHIAGASLANYVNTAAAHVIVGAVNGKVALGLYDRSHSLVVRPLTQVMMPVGRVAVPALARLLQEPERYARAFVLMLQVTHAACLPGLIAVVLAADPLIALLLGPKWTAMTPVFFWIGVGGMAAALAESTYWLFASQARASEQMRCGVLTAAITVAAIALGSDWGVQGVAQALALGMLCLRTPLVVWVATRSGPVTRAMVLRGMAPLLLSAAAAATGTALALRLMDGAPVLQVVTSLGASYGFFLAALLAQPAGRRLIAEGRAALSSRTSPADPGDPRDRLA